MTSTEHSRILAVIRRAIDECNRQHTDAEQRESAMALGLSRYMPEPQMRLPLGKRRWYDQPRP